MGISLAKVEQFEDINWTDFELIGSGAYGYVFVKNKGRANTRYAIKVGTVDREEYEAKKKASENGLAPPVYAYFERVDASKLPEHIQQYTGKRGQVDILVQRRALPYQLMPEDAVTPAMFMRARRSIAQKAVENGLTWLDNHSGNIGKYRGKWVALDGLVLGTGW
jgi:hypothetical protein